MGWDEIRKGGGAWDGMRSGRWVAAAEMGVAVAAKVQVAAVMRATAASTKPVAVARAQVAVVWALEAVAKV